MPGKESKDVLREPVFFKGGIRIRDIPIINKKKDEKGSYTKNMSLSKLKGISTAEATTKDSDTESGSEAKAQDHAAYPKKARSSLLELENGITSSSQKA